MDVIQEAQDLRELIHYHNQAYYVNDMPVVSDHEYDQLFQRLQQLEDAHPECITNDSPTRLVAGSVSDKFQPVKHTLAMMSLKTVTDYTDQAAVEFDLKTRELLGVDELVYCAEPKFDGLAINLKYVNGLLSQASTRGDHETGEDVTHTVMAVMSVPRKIQQTTVGLRVIEVPPVMEVRGEIYMPLSVFKQLNAQRQAAGEKPFVNPRNAAAGSVRQNNPQVTLNRSLQFFAYQFVNEDKPQAKQSEVLEDLRALGFPVCTLNQTLRSGQDLAMYRNFIGQIRSTLDYEIDGVVYKVDSFEQQAELGWTSREPKWAVAHKYLPEEAQTQIREIRLQVGRTGKVTPVAVLTPVYAGGVTITNATLHNQDEIDRKDIRIADYVMVRRAGDVVPEVTSVLAFRRDSTSIPYSILKTSPTCPYCNTALVRNEDQADIYCPGGYACPAQTKRALEHFCSKKCMNIDGIGTRLIERLVDLDMVKYPHELYLLSQETLISSLGLGPKESLNILGAIQTSKHTELWRLIHGLGIADIGESTAKLLAKQFADLQNLKRATEMQLSCISGIGEITARSIARYFANEINSEIVDHLLLAGVHWDIQLTAQTKTGPLHNKTAVITGRFTLGTRSEVERCLMQLGATVAAAVTKKTDILVCGQDAGDKLLKAQSMGIAIMVESELAAVLSSDDLNNSMHVLS